MILSEVSQEDVFHRRCSLLPGREKIRKDKRKGDSRSRRNRGWGKWGKRKKCGNDGKNSYREEHFSCGNACGTAAENAGKRCGKNGSGDAALSVWKTMRYSTAFTGILHVEKGKRCGNRKTGAGGMWKLMKSFSTDCRKHCGFPFSGFCGERIKNPDPAGIFPCAKPCGNCGLRVRHVPASCGKVC